MDRLEAQRGRKSTHESYCIARLALPTEGHNGQENNDDAFMTRPRLTYSTCIIIGPEHTACVSSVTVPDYSTSTLAALMR